jgi:predicted aspartyl protease
MIETKCGFIDGPQGSGASLLAIYGPTLKVDIGFDSNYKPKPDIIPVSGIKNVDALVDTGASESCIDNLLASSLNLPIVDRRAISGVGGRTITNMYLAQIHIPSLKFTIYGAFAGVDLRAGGQPHNALIGRTFLQIFTMIYEGKTGNVTLSSS